MKHSLIIVCLLLHQFLFAQIHRTPVSSSYTHIITYSALNNDVFSFTANQASLASIKKTSIGVFAERRFMLQELGQYSAAFTLPTASGNFGFKGDYFGNSSVNEMQAGLAYARKLSDKVDVGVQFNYNNITATGYGSGSSINFDAGVIFHLSEQLHTGVHVYNPLSSKIGKLESEKMAAIYSVGIGYDVSEKLYAGAEIEKVEDRPVNVNAGIQYRVDDKLLTRGGVSTASSVYYFGVGIILKEIRIDAIASIHPHLGVTPGLLLIYSAK